MDKEERADAYRPLERHLQTLIVIIIVGLLGWVGTTVQETQVAVAKLGVELEFVKAEMRRPDAKFQRIEQRLDAIEKAVSEHANGRQTHTP